MESSHQQQASIKKRRAERELFFWTAFKALDLIVATTLVVCILVSLIEGDWPIRDLLLRLLGSD